MQTSALKLLLTPLLAAAALGTAGCGSDSASDAADKVQQSTDQIQQDAQQAAEDAADALKDDANEKTAPIREAALDYQEKAQKIADDVKAGKLTDAEGEAKIKKLTDDAEAAAKKAASDSLDAIKDQLTPEQRQQLEEAQKNLGAGTN